MILSHGFPYDPHAYDAVAPALTKAGARVIVPWLRGFGGTRFRDATTPRSGQQATLATDLIGLVDALGLRRAILGDEGRIGDEADRQVEQELDWLELSARA